MDEKMSREDMLAFENLRLKQQMLNMEHNALVSEISVRYALAEGDGIDVVTGAIARAVAKAEPCAADDEPKTAEAAA